MLKKIKNEKGAVLVMIIVITTCTILLLSALADFAYYNYSSIKSKNARSAAYLIADEGMEKTIKNFEALIESAKNYANEKVRADGSYDSFIENGDISKVNYTTNYEKYYREFISGNYNSIQIMGGTTSLSGALYDAQVDSSTINDIKNNDKTNYQVKLIVTGTYNNNFSRVVEAVIGINPWGYESITGNSEKLSIDANSDIVYSSPQWSSALASSGDIIVNGGQVNVNGDIYVNGHTATSQTEIDGKKYGGLIVGNGTSGNLNVYGNVFSNNYVHTEYPGSNINILKRATINNYDTEIDKIYNNPVAKYSENSTNLLTDPLSASTLAFGMCNQNYIDYLKSTYDIQKNVGGFVYANNLQVENVGIGSSNINVDGSAIIFNNLATDGSGNIYIKNNYYGFKYGFGNSYNNSSSIITNNSNGKIQIGKRLYAGGTAYVIFNNSITPYQTQETASLYKNYYSYINSLADYPLLYNNTSSLSFGPYNLLNFAGNIQSQISHVLGYFKLYKDNTGMDSISQGGLKYDNELLILNSIYDINNLNSSVDMGFSEGVIIGKNTNNKDFAGIINSGITDPYSSYGLINGYKSIGSLDSESFIKYIANKYSTLMEIKALKNDSGNIITIKDLIMGPSPTDSTTKAIENNDYVLNEGTINEAHYITSSGDVTINNSFKGVIIAGGKVTISSNSDITIDGAIISANDTDKTGIEFVGSGKKTITYNKQMLLDIFRDNSFQGQAIKNLLTSRRGIIEMFNLTYNNNSGFKSAIDSYATTNSLTTAKAIEAIANMYEIDNPDEIKSDKIVFTLGLTTSGASSSKNYQIISWKAVQ